MCVVLFVLLVSGEYVYRPMHPLPRGRHQHAAVSTQRDGLLVIGGGHGTPISVYQGADTVLRLDVTGQWVTGVQLPAGRVGLGCVILADSDVLCCGGADDTQTVVDSCYRLSSVSQSWSTVRSLPVGLKWFGFASDNNHRVWVTAGLANSGLRLDVYDYDALSDTWTRYIGVYPNLVAGHQCVYRALAAPEVVCCGGHDGASLYYSQCHQHDMSNRLSPWSSTTSLPQSTWGQGCTIQHNTDTMWCVGGATNSGDLDTVTYRDLPSGQWVSVDILPTHMRHVEVVQSDGVMHVIGGYDGTQSISYHGVLLHLDTHGGVTIDLEGDPVVRVPFTLHIILTQTGIRASEITSIFLATDASCVLSTVGVPFDNPLSYNMPVGPPYKLVVQYNTPHIVYTCINTTLRLLPFHVLLHNGSTNFTIHSVDETAYTSGVIDTVVSGTTTAAISTATIITSQAPSLTSVVDAQLFTLLGNLECSTTSSKSALLGARFLLQPAALLTVAEHPTANRLLSNIILTIVLTAMHAMIAVAMAAARPLYGFRRCRGIVRFPRVGLITMIILYQAVTLDASRLIFQSHDVPPTGDGRELQPLPTWGVAVGVISLHVWGGGILLCVTSFVFLWKWCGVHCALRCYPLAFLGTVRCHSVLPSTYWKDLHPMGPHPFNECYGPLYAEFRSGRVKCFLIATLVRLLSLSIVIACPLPCRLRVYLTLGIQTTYAVLCVGVRPWRTVVDNVCRCILCCLHALLPLFLLLNATHAIRVTIVVGCSAVMMDTVWLLLKLVIQWRAMKWIQCHGDDTQGDIKEEDGNPVETVETRDIIVEDDYYVTSGMESMSPTLTPISLALSAWEEAATENTSLTVPTA